MGSLRLTEYYNFRTFSKMDCGLRENINDYKDISCYN
jgi:hypothetical protein